MLSEDQGLSRAEKVFCKIINDQMPIAVCQVEQGTSECNGCAAKSRRCMNCKGKKGIASPQRGLCESCLRAEERASKPLLEGEPEQAVVKALDRVRAFGSLGTGLPVATKQWKSKESGEPRALSPFLQKPGILYRVLLEHALVRNKKTIVNEPARVLMHRFHLLRDEAVKAIEILCKEGYVQGEEPWKSILLLKPDESLSVDDGEGSGSEAMPKVRADVRVRPPMPLPKSHLGQAEVLPKMSVSVVKPLTQNPTPLYYYRDLYEHLISRSNPLRGEQLVGGALPMLQIRFKLSATQARQAIEWLEANGHLQQKDQWRTIVLLSTSISSDEGLMANVVARKATHESRAPQLTGKVDVPPTTQTALQQGGVNPTVTTRDMRMPRAIYTELVANLESTLVSLRVKRDSLNSQVAQLEAGLIALKSFQGQIDATTAVADESLAEAIQAVQKLFSALRG